MNYPDAQINIAEKECLANADCKTGPTMGHGLDVASARREQTPQERERNLLLERLKDLNEDELCNSLRRQLGNVELTIRQLSRNLQPGERRDQATLALRHTEDARMRLGKVIQHGSSGGKSIYG